MRTVGQLLKTQREKRKIPATDIYKYIKVHPRFITALENDDYSVFEGKVHAKGFLKIYAEFLGLNLEEILALWRREYEPYLKDSNDTKFSKMSGIEKAKLTITPNLILITTIFILMFGFFGYLYYQYKTYTGAPRLDIYYPENNIVIESDILDINGKTELDSQVFINAQKIVQNPDGSFATSVKLKEGLNTLSISAINKLGKESEIIRTIIYRPKEIIKEATESTQSTPSIDIAL